MRQRATWLVLAALAVLGLAAAVDAFRGGEKRVEPPSASSRAPRTGTAYAPLSPQEGLEGVLYYTDENCRLRALDLPRLIRAEAPDWEECAFSLSPSGLAVESTWTVWSPTGVAAEDVGDAIEVGPDGESFRGSLPTWRPDGTLTYVQGDAVRAWPSRRVLIAPAALRPVWARYLGTRPRFVGPVRVIQLGWLTPTRAVVALGVTVRSVGEFGLTAVFERKRLVGVVHSFPRLWTSPGGGFFALGGSGALQLYDRDGEAVPLPVVLTEPRSIAWSPDEGWIAVSTRASIFLVRLGDEPSVRRLALEARELAWLPPGREQPVAAGAAG
jgi:hypothetical protein